MPETVELVNGHQVRIARRVRISINDRMEAAVAATMRVAQRTIMSGQVQQLTLARRVPDGNFLLNLPDADLGRDVPIKLDRQVLVNGFIGELERQRAVYMGVSRSKLVDQTNAICRFSEDRFVFGTDGSLSLVHIFNSRFGDGITADEYIMRRNQEM